MPAKAARLPFAAEGAAAAQTQTEKGRRIAGKRRLPALGAIHHGDCLQMMRTMPDESIRLVVTSPPYNIKNSSGNGLKNGSSGKWPRAALQAGYDAHADCMPHADYVSWQRECLAEMLRLLKPDGAIFYNHKWRVQNGLLQDRSDIVAGFPVRQILIWHRAGGINFNPGYFLPNYEVIYLIAKPAFKLAPKANAMGCVWKINQESNTPHPAPFPVELALRCIRAAGAGPVLDPFMGSGSTALAAIRAGVGWLGIEQSRTYIKAANKRIEGGGSGAFWRCASSRKTACSRQ